MSVSPGRAASAVIAGGYTHTLALKEDGTVWAWGDNGDGQLGDGTTVSKSSPVLVQGLFEVQAIAAGSGFSVALRSDGTVWAWGNNQFGQLGDNSTEDRTTPVMVLGLTGAVAVSAGYKHVLALKADGTVWSWGQNSSEQLGYEGSDLCGPKASSSCAFLPQQVASLGNVAAIAAGYYHSMALIAGQVWSWGGNSFGQRGDNGTDKRSSPALVQNLAGVAVTAVAAAVNHTLALGQDGTVWAWGANKYGQLGDGTSGVAAGRYTPGPVEALADVASIAVGYEYSMALKGDGTVWAWGKNINGQLGFAPTELCGANEPICSIIPGQVEGVSGVSAIASGYFHELSTGADGGLLTWGKNDSGQLGYETDNETTVSVPQQPESAGDSGAFNLQTPTPTVNFSASSQILAEDGGPVMVTATLGVAASSLNVVVPFALSGTAAAGEDYLEPLDGTIVIPAGQLTGSVSFDLLDDALDEADETIILTMVSPVNAIKGTSAVHTVSITDNDGPPTAVVSGVPASPTNQTAVTLTVGGAGVTAYKYKLDADDFPTEEIPADTPITASALGEGDHTVLVISRDTAGNWQAEENATAVTWTVDLTPPTALLANQPSSPTFSTGIVLTVDGAGVVAYKYKIDGGAYAAEVPVATPISATGLATGQHEVAVLGRDAAGNWQPADQATTFAWEISDLGPGNINGDDAVDLQDAILVLQVMAGRDPAGIHREADLNNDGRLGLAEALYVLGLLAN